MDYVIMFVVFMLVVGAANILYILPNLEDECRWIQTQNYLFNLKLHNLCVDIRNGEKVMWAIGFYDDTFDSECVEFIQTTCHEWLEDVNR